MPLLSMNELGEVVEHGFDDEGCFGATAVRPVSAAKTASATPAQKVAVSANMPANSIGITSMPVGVAAVIPPTTAAILRATPVSAAKVPASVAKTTVVSAAEVEKARIAADLAKAQADAALKLQLAKIEAEKAAALSAQISPTAATSESQVRDTGLIVTTGGTALKSATPAQAAVAAQLAAGKAAFEHRHPMWKFWQKRA